jgi:para-nitrobenzyl esterase
LPVEDIVRAGATATEKFGSMVFNGVVDGVAMPAHPVELLAAGVAADIPLMIGTTTDEFRSVMLRNPAFDTMDDAGLRAMLGGVIGRRDTGDGVDEPLAVYRKRRPDASPGELFGDVFTDYAHIGAVRTADAKVAAASAPVFMYLFAAAPANHGLDVAYLFRYGVEDDLADQMGDTWVAFARTGDPNHPGLPKWPEYSLDERATMIFDYEPRVENDPLRDVRLAWAGIRTTR